MLARSKKDIDRELMYKKILPTAMAADSVSDKTALSKNMEETLPAGVAVATLEVSIQKPVEVVFPAPLAIEASPQKSPELASEAPLIPTQFETAAVPAPVQEAAHPADAAVSATELPLVNLMEAFVEKRLDAALKKFKCCTCDRCRKDVLAIALNKLPPLYVIEDDADIRDLHERERAAQVATALVQAILAVKAHPSHEIVR